MTPPGLQVRDVLGVDGSDVLFTASQEPTEIGLWSYGPGGLAPVADGAGLFTGRRAGGTTVVTSRSLDEDGVTVRVLRADTGAPAARIASHEETPNLPVPRPRMLSLGPREARTALLFPSWHEPGSGPLPVLLDPYGGPHAQRVLAARGAYLTSQWFAEQGFAVLIADGRGTPGRGPAWDRAVAGNFADPVLEDQIDALHAAAAQFGDLDLARVAIRGWSFGGYLSALAALRRPDVFHAAIAGAPVTDRRLYDTHYTERYLGDPATSPAPTTIAPRSGTRNGCAAARHVPADDDHPRAGRRQRGGRAHPAAVVRAARRGLSAHRPAAVRGDPHDPSGSRCGEPAAAAG